MSPTKKGLFQTKSIVPNTKRGLFQHNVPKYDSNKQKLFKTKKDCSNKGLFKQKALFPTKKGVY